MRRQITTALLLEIAALPPLRIMALLPQQDIIVLNEWHNGLADISAGRSGDSIDLVAPYACESRGANERVLGGDSWNCYVKEQYTLSSIALR